MKRIFCIIMLIVLASSGSVYADNAKIQLGADVYNLVTTFCGDAGTMRGFAWSAKSDYSNMAIRYAKDGEWGNAITKNAEYTEYDGRLYYKAELTGLTAGVTYEYKIGDISKDVWSSSYTFTTEPENLTDFSFIGVTDPQSDSKSGFAYYTDTIEKALEDDADASFMVNLGDMVDIGNDQNQWDLYFESVKGIVESMPHMAVVGNHETRGDETTAGKQFSLQFNNPDNGANAFGNLTEGDMSSSWGKGVLKNKLETVYSFDYGNAHFAVLNSGTDWSESDKKTIMIEQAKWLRNDLCATDKKWKIVMIHMGLYPAKTERYNTREELMDVIDECGVDLVLSGHDHMIARTYPMYQNKIETNFNTSSVITNGTVYNIIGSAGLKRYNEVTQTPNYLQVLRATTSTQPTYSLFDINDERIKVVSKQLDGTVLDKYSIQKINIDHDDPDIANGNLLVADYNTGEIIYSGNIQSSQAAMSMIVTKPGSVLSKNVEIDDIVACEEVETDAYGGFSFEFKIDRIAGNYTIYTNYVNGPTEPLVRNFALKTTIPTMNVEKDGIDVTQISQLTSGDELDITLSGFDLEDDYPGEVIVAQYVDGSLSAVEIMPAIGGSIYFGDEIEKNITVIPNAEKIKIFYWNSVTIMPLIATYTID